MSTPKKKPTGGKHTTKRRAIPLPEEWVALAEQCAAEEKQPTGWFVVSLLKRYADEKKRPSPVPPWDKKKLDTLPSKK